MPFIVGAGVLPKKWGPPESKVYVADEQKNRHPFSFVNPANFNDTMLATAARLTLKNAWKKCSVKRYQASGRVVSLRSLLLALKHRSGTDPELFRSLTLHCERLEKVCVDLDAMDAKEKAVEAASIAKTIAAPLVAQRRQQQQQQPAGGAAESAACRPSQTTAVAHEATQLRHGASRHGLHGQTF
jgi:hypothetical protein